MTSTQYISISLCLLLLLVLYFACETTPPGQNQIEKSRVLNAEVVDVNALERDALIAIPPQQSMLLQGLQEEIGKSLTDSSKVTLLKQLSGQWFQAGYPALAGHYAQELAVLENTEQSWSIAATTYAICVQRSDDQDIRQFCNERAVTAFESAISLNPADVSHKVNLALTYTESPPEDQPMKGVLMLVDLQKEFPENVLVINTLARLAVQTGQIERAEERLLQALAIEPNNKTTICLLSEVYNRLGELDKANQYAQQCQN